ncbi:hypothetical protein A9X04_22855 [Mycobacterium sp. E3247]|nr:hypothetical protein A9X04_22855 [Mycobacterium sp. E3247]
MWEAPGSGVGFWGRGNGQSADFRPDRDGGRPRDTEPPPKTRIRDLGITERFYRLGTKARFPALTAGRRQVRHLPVRPAHPLRVIRPVGR